MISVFLGKILKNYFAIRNQYTQVLLIAKFSEKGNAQIREQEPLICIFFFRWNFKTLLSYLESTPSNLWNMKILWKNKKSLNLGRKRPYLGIFRPEFSKALVVLEFNPLKYVKFQTFVKKQNDLNLGPKIINYCHTWNQHPQIS